MICPGTAWRYPRSLGTAGSGSSGSHHPAVPTEATGCQRASAAAALGAHHPPCWAWLRALQPSVPLPWSDLRKTFQRLIPNVGSQETAPVSVGQCRGTLTRVGGCCVCHGPGVPSSILECVVAFPIDPAVAQGEVVHPN